VGLCKFLKVFFMPVISELITNFVAVFVHPPKAMPRLAVDARGCQKMIE
jgi:hypothetical protein